MMTSFDEISKKIQEWKEESENRSIVVLAIEGSEDEDGTGINLANTTIVCGNGMHLTSSVCRAIEDKRNPMGGLIRDAIAMKVMMDVSDKAEKIAKKARETFEKIIDECVEDIESNENESESK